MRWEYSQLILGGPILSDSKARKDSNGNKTTWRKVSQIEIQTQNCQQNMNKLNSTMLEISGIYLGMQGLFSFQNHPV